MLRVRNWHKFQHYKDRNPPWIKLATDTFQNPDFARLQGASKLLALCIWTLASRSKDGSVPDDLNYILQWGFITGQATEENLKELIDKGFVIPASGLLAFCEQDAMPETETEAYKPNTEEAEERQIYARSDPRSRANASPPGEAVDIPLLLNTGVNYYVGTEQVKEWQSLYPAVDVMQELRNMRGWCLVNPTKRKTASGVPRFINHWLETEQNRNPRTKTNGRAERKTILEAIRDSEPDQNPE